MEAKKMTVRQVAERLNQILKDNPKVADIPFVVKKTVNRRRTEYLPVAWISGSALGLAQSKEGEDWKRIDVLEATNVDEFFVWDSSKGLRMEGAKVKSY